MSDAAWNTPPDPAREGLVKALKEAESLIVNLYRAINPAANYGESNRMVDVCPTIKTIRAALCEGIKQEALNDR